MEYYRKLLLRLEFLRLSSTFRNTLHGRYSGVANTSVCGYNFYYLQIELRRATFQVLNVRDFESDLDLYQWFHGSKLCAGLLECLVTLENDIDTSGPEYVEVKMRGPRDSARECFIFIDEVIAIVFHVSYNFLNHLET